MVNLFFLIIISRRKPKIRYMVVRKKKNESKKTAKVIDNSKNFQFSSAITHSLYLVADPKTGKIKQECRTQK